MQRGGKRAEVCATTAFDLCIPTHKFRGQAQGLKWLACHFFNLTQILPFFGGGGVKYDPNPSVS